MVRSLGLKLEGKGVRPSNGERGRCGWYRGSSGSRGLQGLSISHLPPGKDERLVTVRLHPCPPPDFFRPCRLLPSKNNVRTAWYQGQSPSGDGEYQGGVGGKGLAGTSPLTTSPFLSQVAQSPPPPTITHGSCRTQPLSPMRSCYQPCWAQPRG